MTPTFPTLVAFDLDGTLTPSKLPMTPTMAHAIEQLLEVCDVCIISGGKFAQFQRQFLHILDMNKVQAQHLHLMPTCGAQYITFDSEDEDWYSHYQLLIPDDIRQKVIRITEATARQMGLWEAHVWGKRIEDRGSQITFSALGQDAPAEEKSLWDPTGDKRKSLAAKIQAQCPELDVHSGGSTSVDMTMRGIDKAYGMKELMNRLDLSPSEIIFYGDRLDESGNDYPVTTTGVTCVMVKKWEDTLEHVEALVQQAGTVKL
ncbi:MAG: HAD-IIB family hydrolase [Actinomycetaceae bacterium]|nr:HAD-IIB family hydrolase [Actinomycetaceae bacterium]